MDGGDELSSTMKISLPWRWRPVKRRMLPGSELFTEGDVALHTARKFIPLEDKSEKSQQKTKKDLVPCCVIGCTQTFTSLLSYENHYNSQHRHSCITCHRTFPSSYLLDVHIQENHDPLFSILASGKNMYQCLVESCDVKFSRPDDRRQHLIKTHHYPANFRFHRLRPENKKKKQQKTSPTTDTMDVDAKPTGTDNTPQNNDSSDKPLKSSPQPDAVHPESSSDKENAASRDTGSDCAGKDGDATAKMDVCETEKPSAPRRVFVHKVPQNFTFGHGVGRGFQRPLAKRGKKRGGHWHQRVDNGTRETTCNIENVDMKDMAEALNDAV